MGEQRLRVLRQSLKRCCTRSSWLAGTDIVLIGCPPSTVEWTADDTNSISKIHAALPKGHQITCVNPVSCFLNERLCNRVQPPLVDTLSHPSHQQLTAQAPELHANER